jgi:hypothetical protein
MDAGQPVTLPARGVLAKTTPRGIEALPTPPATPTIETPANESESDPAFNTPQSNPAPAAKPGDPITRYSPNASNNPAEAIVPQRPRTVADAMRPLDQGPASTGGPYPATTAAPESIPAPASPSTDDRSERYRAERAEQESRAQQSRYDRAQLARNVPFRFSDSNRFSLEYELEAVGASGVESVELYGSLDGGKSWKRWGADPDRSSPFDIETKGEGLFSFRIVVLGNNGLASPRPLPGDRPDIAVVVDQTKPNIRLTSARYGEGDRIGSLVIQYECSDENLMNRPVSIAFSDSIDGPWTTIAAGLRNDGIYVWPADPKLPPAIYLRIDATDQAGNTGSYLLDQPIATGGLAPRARILGFRSR